MLCLTNLAFKVHMRRGLLGLQPFKCQNTVPDHELGLSKRLQLRTAVLFDMLGQDQQVLHMEVVEMQSQTSNSFTIYLLVPWTVEDSSDRLYCPGYSEGVPRTLTGG